MNHIGLFEGVGGFSLAARWMGWETVAWCEWDEFCQRVLKYHFPNAEQHGDITTTDFTRYAGQIDILTGGFPCQGFSAAGKRLGTSDDRWLWPQMLRAITEIKPPWIVGENVVGITNLDGAKAFGCIKNDLEAIGYEVECYDLPACSVGLQTMERHIWIVAKNINFRREGGLQNKDKDIKDSKRKFQGDYQGARNRWNISESKFCRVDQRVSGRLDKSDKERLKQIGNAINPQVALQIFKAIQEYENLTKI